MNRTTINLHTRLTTAAGHARDIARRDRERGSVTVEQVLWITIFVALVAVAGTALTLWVQGKLAALG